MNRGAVLEGDAGLVPEVDALRERIAHLERESLVDPLTGAWNRRYLDRAVFAEARRGRRHRQPLSAALVDIDHFRAINDAHGHAGGDAVLRELAAALQAVIRACDLLARWGGEEFLVLLPGTEHRAAGILAERLRRLAAGVDFPPAGAITVSVGVAELLWAESPEAFFARLDHALRRAKDAGRNRVMADASGASDGWKREDGGAIMALRWRESYASGDPAVDGEHRELFERANGLIALMLRPEASPAERQAAMDACLLQAAAHFAREERMLAGHAGLEAHKAAHRALLGRAQALRQAVAWGETRLGALVEFFAHELVARHLLVEDQAFFEERLGELRRFPGAGRP